MVQQFDARENIFITVVLADNKKYWNNIWHSRVLLLFLSNVTDGHHGK